LPAPFGPREAVDLAGQRGGPIPCTALTSLNVRTDARFDAVFIGHGFRLPAAETHYSDLREHAELCGKVEVQAFVSSCGPTPPWSAGFDRELVADHGLTINDYEVLLAGRAPDRTARRDGSGAAGTAHAVGNHAAPRTVAALRLRREGGLPTATARVVYAKLTDAGRAKLKERDDRARGEHPAMFGERFSEDELRTLCDFLDPPASEASD